MVKPQSFDRVIVDSTIMEKAVAYPTDSRLLERARQHLVRLAGVLGIPLQQSYNRTAPRLAIEVGLHPHHSREQAHLSINQQITTVHISGSQNIISRNKTPSGLKVGVCLQSEPD